MQESSIITPQPIVASIGEALFDCLPAGAVLGGAPVNFAVHLQQLFEEHSGQVAIVSGIGADELGLRLLDEVGCRHVRTDLIQTVSGGQTGQVQVTFSPEGEPSYHIVENAAWDFIGFPTTLQRLAEGCQAVYFGTLAQRSPQSRETIQRFVANTQGIRVLDLNFRRPFVDAATVESSLSLANIVKLNEEELLAVRELLPSRFGESRALDELASRLLQAYRLEFVALTRGARGTVLYTPNGRYEGRVMQFDRAAEADSVGAGDACCAGLAYGRLHDWPLARTLELANRLGAYVASQPGGTPKLSEEMLDFVRDDAGHLNVAQTPTRI